MADTPRKPPTPMPRDPTSPWLTATEAGAYLKRSRFFILREIHAGRLRAAKIGGRGEILTRVDWLDAYITDMATPIAFPARRQRA